jgi:hypothetical protein
MSACIATSAADLASDRRGAANALLREPKQYTFYCTGRSVVAIADWYILSNFARQPHPAASSSTNNTTRIDRLGKYFVHRPAARIVMMSEICRDHFSAA